MENNLAVEKETPRQFVFRNKSNRRLLYLALGICTLEWVIFKIAYPFPDFFSDSYSYIVAAAQNWDINIWPIGYSKFLRLFHFLTNSDTALVSFQFMLLESSTLYLLLSTKKIYSFSKNAQYILLLFLLCNPIFFYLSNYITPDSLFASFSILWFTELLWLINSFSYQRLLLQALYLSICFTLRYNALYYPLISIIAIAMCHRPPWSKLLGSLTPALFLIPFLIYSENAGKSLTGKSIYSILGGWQLANNALYIRGQITLDTTSFPSPECSNLDSIARNFFRSAGPNFKNLLDNHTGNFFIQDWRAPLKVYMLSKYKETNVQAWGMAAPIFAAYGSHIIETHPISYARYFMLMNTGNYLMPPLEKLKVYNMGLDSVREPAQYWFDYGSNKIAVVSNNLQNNILFLTPLLFLLLNFSLLGAVLIYYLSKTPAAHPQIAGRLLLLTTSFWLINLVFSITANVIALRYQFTPLILLTFAAVILYDKYFELADKASNL